MKYLAENPQKKAIKYFYRFLKVSFPRGNNVPLNLSS